MASSGGGTIASVIVCGGSVIGLASAMLLARDGHEVTVLEQDAAPVPEEPAQAWDEWRRAGVAQFRQPHNVFPPFRHILDEELPGTVDQLVDAGCVRLDPLEWMPPFVRDRGRRPGDDRFRYVTGRRPVVEAVLARRAEGHDGVTVRRGVGVAGLVTGAGPLCEIPHVTGVRTIAGEHLEADLVVDAMGRRSPLSTWLAAVGAQPPHVESEEWRFVYHTRYFRGPELPPVLAPPISEMGTISILTLPGDNGTWSVTVWAASSDTALRALRHPDTFSRVLGACPLHAHWLGGDPITGMLTMAGSLDRYHRFVVDGRPVATGVAAVGDAWACTNPSAGRGMTVGLIHAQRLRDVVASELREPVALAHAWDEVTEAEVAPFYWDQVRADRARAAEMDALRKGDDPLPPDPTMAALATAAFRDPEAFRAVLEMAMCLALPEEVLARPTLKARLDAVRRPGGLRLPGPDRSQLLQLLA